MKMNWITRKIIVFAIIACLFSSCIPSIHPLYSDDTLRFEESLIGSWILYDTGSETERDQWNFVPFENKEGYHVSLVKENGEESHFDVHLVKLGDHYYCDFLRVDRDNIFNVQGIAPKVPMHSFARIEFKEGGFVLHHFDIEWLQKQFEQKKIRLKHEINENGDIILTASTKELQKFIKKYGTHSDATVTPSVYTKA